MTVHPRHSGFLVGRPDDFGLQISDGGLKRASTANPPSAIRHPPSPRGFTLLELLAAMSLMVAVASCLYTALFTGFRAYRGAQAAVDPTLVAINVIEMLKQDVSGVLAPGSHLAGAFIGTDSGGVKGVDIDSLEFYTTHVYTDNTQRNGQTTDTPLVGGIGKIALFLEEDSETKDGTYLLLRQVTTNLLAPKTVEADEQVLCRNVVSMNLRYFDGSGWVDGWDSTADANSLPLAVEVDIQIAHRDKHSKELQKRRLIQSFIIPCKTESTTTDAAASGTSASATKTSTPANNNTKPTTK